MISPHYEPLSADRLRELIENCSENIASLTARGQHKYAGEYYARRRRYEKRLALLEHQQEATKTPVVAPIMQLRQVSDAEWRRMAEERKENEG